MKDVVPLTHLVGGKLDTHSYARKTIVISDVHPDLPYFCVACTYVTLLSMCGMHFTASVKFCYGCKLERKNIIQARCQRRQDFLGPCASGKGHTSERLRQPFDVNNVNT